LRSREHDDLHAMTFGVNIFRSDLQSQLALQLIDLLRGAKRRRCGKSALNGRTLCSHVVDLSEDYVPVWNEWIPAKREATFAPPRLRHSHSCS
jgi:hypothetical protein